MGFCRICGERFTGRNASHCSGCHRTFKSVGSFDKHRVNYGCVDPAELGMTINNDLWCQPMPEKYKERLRNLHKRPL